MEIAVREGEGARMLRISSFSNGVYAAPSRLFDQGSFCPICLRTYTNSTELPMICCDKCNRWFHAGKREGREGKKIGEFSSEGWKWACR